MQAPDRPVEGGQAGAGSTRDMSLARHTENAAGHARSHPGPPGTNPWPAPAITAGTDMPRLTRHVNGTAILLGLARARAPEAAVAGWRILLLTWLDPAGASAHSENRAAHVPDHGPCCMARHFGTAAGTDRKLMTFIA